MKKTNLRRLLAAVLCLVMVLSLFTACSKSSESSSKSSKDDDEKKEEKTSSTYKTPLDNMMDMLNAKSYKAQEKAYIARTNGLFETELKKIREIEKKSENYEDELDDAEDDIRDAVDNYEDEYGDDYEYYYEIDDKDQIKKSDLTASKKSLKAYAKQQEEYYKELKEDDEQLEWMAEQAGLKKGQMEDIIDLKIEIFKELQKVEITEGYELDYTLYMKGSELEEPKDVYDGERTIKVYKIDGKWVEWSSYYDCFAEIEDDATEPDEY